MKEMEVQSLGWEDLLEDDMATNSIGKSYGQRSLVGYSPRGHKRVGYDLMTKQQQQMLSQIKQSFKGHSARPLRGELSDGEEVGSAVRLRV